MYYNSPTYSKVLLIMNTVWVARFSLYMLSKENYHVLAKMKAEFFPLYQSQLTFICCSKAPQQKPYFSSSFCSYIIIPKIKTNCSSVIKEFNQPEGISLK